LGGPKLLFIILLSFNFNIVSVLETVIVASNIPIAFQMKTSMVIKILHNAVIIYVLAPFSYLFRINMQKILRFVPISMAFYQTFIVINGVVVMLAVVWQEWLRDSII
jgi:hypothetical protein